MVSGSRQAIGDAFDEADEVADEADDAVEEGAGTAAVRGAETAAHIMLTAGYRFRNNSVAAWSSAVDAGLSAQRVRTPSTHSRALS